MKVDQKDLGRTQKTTSPLGDNSEQEEDSGQTNENRCADACVNSGITRADRTAAREQEIQSLKEALKILES